jgi:hypothetical protein
LIVAQQCLYVAGNKEVCLGVNVKYPNFYLFVTKFGFCIQTFVLNAHYQFSLKSASYSRADACYEPADGRTDLTKLMGDFRDYTNALKIRERAGEQ